MRRLKKPPLTYEKLNIDGVEMLVNIGKMKVNHSVFIPCIRTKSAVFKLHSMAKKWGRTVKCLPVVEDGIQGVRMWRIL
jgi:hypothetical protein